jgi:hypothetical protein
MSSRRVRLGAILASVVTVLLLSGCVATVEPTGNPSAPADITITPEPTPSPIPSPSPLRPPASPPSGNPAPD